MGGGRVQPLQVPPLPCLCRGHVTREAWPQGRWRIHSCTRARVRCWGQGRAGIKGSGGSLASPESPTLQPQTPFRIIAKNSCDETKNTALIPLFHMAKNYCGPNLKIGTVFAPSHIVVAVKVLVTICAKTETWP